MNSIKIKDVARLAGVSPACVSLVLNNKPYVSPETREKIYKAIKKLNYRPNIIARSLRKKETTTIGLVLPDITNPFFPEVARGVETRAKEYGFSVILCNSDADPVLEKESIEILLAKQVDGLILTSAHRKNDLIENLEKDIPVVLVNRELFPGKFDFVGIDNLNSAKTMVRHLLKLGHKRIAFIKGEPASSASADRYKGYILALKEAGIIYSKNLVKTGYLKYEGGYQAIQSLLASSSPPTAIFCANDMMALGALDACKDKGIKVPQDVAIVGFDDIWLASLKGIELTTIRQPRYLMGVNAVDLLIERITGKRDKIKRLILPSELVVRKTCGTDYRK